MSGIIPPKTVDQVRAAIVQVLKDATGLKHLHPYERYAQREVDLRLEYLDDTGKNKVLKGGYVRRFAVDETVLTAGFDTVIDRWRVVLIRALEDKTESELEFDKTIEDARDAIREDETLGGVVLGVDDGERIGLQVLRSEPALFAGVLCHWAELGLSTRRRFARKFRTR